MYNFLNKKIIDLAERLDQSGHKLYIVGGAVRDLLIYGIPTGDIDLCTDATPDQLHSLLSDKRLIDVGEAFGVTIFYDEEMDDVEIATLRKDLTSGRKPEVAYTESIEEDVQRRDFTINALYYDILEDEIIDLVGGKEDLKNGLLRTVGNPADRFVEDSLRKLRALRFAHRFEFRKDKELLRSLKKDTSLEGVSDERIRNEFMKCATQCQNSEDFISELIALGYVHHFFGDLKVTLPRSSGHDPILLLAQILHKNDPREVEDFLKSRSYTSSESFEVRMLIGVLNDLLDTPEGFYAAHKALKAGRLCPVHVLSLGFVYHMETETKALVCHEEVTDAHELMEQGFKGPELGTEIRRQEFKAFEEAKKSFMYHV